MRRALSLAAATLVLCGAMGAVPAFSEDPTAKDIVEALAPKASLLRSLDAAQEEKKQADLVGRLQGATTRQITVEERNEIADVVEANGLPAIDLEIFFKFDSAKITPEAMKPLNALGAALGDPKLKGSIFLLAGHTDANGSDVYNLALSDVRAKSVRALLIDQFHVDPKRLVAVGFGEEQLKNKANPAAGENRRVQVVNIQSAPVAAKTGAPSSKDTPNNPDCTVGASWFETQAAPAPHHEGLPPHPEERQRRVSKDEANFNVFEKA